MESHVYLSPAAHGKKNTFYDCLNSVYFSAIFKLYSVLDQANAGRCYGQNGITLHDCMTIIQTNHLNGTLVTG